MFGVRVVFGVLVLIGCGPLAARARAQAAQDQPPPKKEDKPPRKPALVPAALAERPRGKKKPQVVVSLVNLWTREVLPVVVGERVSAARVNHFLRCHFTGQKTQIDARLIDLVVAAARRFKSERAEIVSAYRHPKYNLMLRKKGREVAGGSNHMAGKAIDFRIPGTSTRALRAFVIKAGIGGVGYYPRSQFVHADVGKRRTWNGR